MKAFPRLVFHAVFLPALAIVVGCASPPGAPDAASREASPEDTTVFSACGLPKSGWAGGRIASQSFVADSSTIKEGILELREGAEFFADRSVTIFLFLDEGEVPEGSSYEAKADGGFGSPHVHMSWKAPSEPMPSTEIFMDGYTMSLDFGEEKDGVLPGTLHLCLPDEQESFVSGKFEAKIEGFRLVGGEPDFAQDSHKNFRYLAHAHLQQTLGTDDVEILDSQRGQYTLPDENTRFQTGSSEITFRAGEREQSRRFLFVKEPDSWRVHKMLTMDQLPEAHPFEKPEGGKWARKLLSYLVAQELESRVRTQHPGQAIYPANDFSLVEKYRTERAWAEVTTRYKLGSSEEAPVEVRFLLHKGDDGWQVEREMADGEPFRPDGSGGGD